MSGSSASEQLELIRSAMPPAPRRSRPRPDQAAASVDPVASVVVDTGLAHLDRPFEYLVPEALAETAVPGVRVKVRFAGQDLDGFVLARRAVAEHDGRLAPLRRVVSPEPVLTPPLLALTQSVAARYAGTLGDVLRLALPPRHAAAERALALEAPVPDPLPAWPGAGPAWVRYAAGPAYVSRLAAGGSPAASWLALPSVDPLADWPAALAAAAAATLASGRGSVIVVPDHRDVARVDAALTEALGRGRHVRLTADQGPQARYTAWLKVLRGHVSVVVGTRAAAFAPVRDLGLVAWWDDGDDVLEEPRAPYPHVREVLLERGRLEGAAVLSGGSPARSPCTSSSSPVRCARSWPPPCATPSRGSSWRARASRSSVTRRPPRPTCRPSRGAPPRPRWGPVRCSCRCPAGATSRPCPARPVGPRCGARTAPARWPCRAGERSRPVGGAVAGSAGSSAGPAVAASCGRQSSALGAPPRSWAGPSPACRCTPPGPARSSSGWRPPPRW
ncbi:hypothetical protein [Nostocoides sp. HKS02]|uniref:primosomal protein N' family DNA-binding protein n=1 Tax=Nostocoides sp. HKS02 TaxID=1813880 RepID=UPI00351AFBF2